ncbi:MAG: hypothetical protein D6698_13040 [Gammaproteobacteria bacterium]|nr:MAG: hypothetical protein D6698_13040 [Gammaproteobacteria bacterium]
MSKKIIASLVIVLGLGALYYFSPAQREARLVDHLVAQNISARGGESAWRGLKSIRLKGQMDVGKDLTVPYTMIRQRPNRMRLDFEFNHQMVRQSTDGKTGWKVVPFQGRTKPEPMTDQELKEAIDTADPYDLLFDYRKRGHKIEYQGIEKVGDQQAHKLKVTLPRGTVRWVFLDAKTGLDIKVETLKKFRGKDRRVETRFKDWRPEGGLLIAHRQETQMEGDKESHFLTVDEVEINPDLEPSLFAMPTDSQLEDINQGENKKVSSSS